MATRALVVGGTSGIGYAIASQIAASNPNSHVTISGRRKPTTPLPSNMEFRQLDASSMRTIKRYTDEYKSSHSEPHLDLLVMSQGIFSLAGRTETPEGIDNKMALHYYGRQLLLRELTPVLKDDAKVVIVLDSVRGTPDKVLWDDMDLKKNFSLSNAANHCIAMNDAMVQFYAAQQKGADNGLKRHYVHAYPGFVKTDLGSGMPWYLRPVIKGAGALLAVSPETCAEHILRGTTEAAVAGEKEGRFWSNIDSKGKVAQGRPVWTTEQMQKVADHTWKIVDEAIEKPEA